jgi:hypothetical protein
MKAYLPFTPYYHEMQNWYNIGNLSLLIFESTEHPSDRYSLRRVQEEIRTLIFVAPRLQRIIRARWEKWIHRPINIGIPFIYFKNL